MKEKRNRKVDVHTIHIFKNLQRIDTGENVWQATKHPTMQGSFCLTKFFLVEETKKLKSKLVTLISNISISEKKGTQRFCIVILPTDILVLIPR